MTIALVFASCAFIGSFGAFAVTELKDELFSAKNDVTISYGAFVWMSSMFLLVTGIVIKLVLPQPLQQQKFPVQQMQYPPQMYPQFPQQGYYPNYPPQNYNPNYQNPPQQNISTGNFYQPPQNNPVPQNNPYAPPQNNPSPENPIDPYKLEENL